MKEPNRKLLANQALGELEVIKLLGNLIDLFEEPGGDFRPSIEVLKLPRGP